MTTRHTPALSSRAIGHSLWRVGGPLLFVSATLFGAGALQQGRISVNQPVAPPAARTAHLGDAGTGSAGVDVGVGRLGQEDPALSMRSLNGRPDVGAASVQVLPAGNVPTTPVPLGSTATGASSTRTQWLTTTESTMLWSGPNVADSVFTDVPENAYLRIEGPQLAGRWPVYYFGDGLLRRPGNGWVDASAATSVDSPPPGQVPAVDAEASLPLSIWVQAHRATLLWSGPDEGAVQLTDLPQWTFLKATGITRGARLLVNYAGDYATRQPGIGWVDQAAVGPAGDPGQWVTNHRATALWSGVDENAARFTELQQWSKLQIVPGAPADANRLEVQFFGDGATRQPGAAWVARADIGPITPPVPLPMLAAKQSATSAQQQVESRTFASDDDFINAVGSAAQRSFKQTGVPASVTVAQAILESDWGRSRLTRQGNNLFGIKALSRPGPAGVVTLATWEHLSASDVVVQAPFKAYLTLEQSIDDHGQFFVRNPRYANALAVGNDPRAFAQAIQDDGYATDPNYATKLTRLMDRYNLYRFDP